MKAIRYLFPLAALLCFVEVLLPDATAQETEELRKEFQSTKAKAEKGDASAQGNLGLMYANGNGVAKDETEALKWLRKAAEQGDAMGQSGLGVQHAPTRSNAHHITRDSTSAVCVQRIPARHAR